MFGLTKREQRWKADQQAAELIVPAIVRMVEAKLAQDTNNRIAALEADLAAAQAKNAEDAKLIAQLSVACEHAETESEWTHMALTNKEKDVARVTAERDGNWMDKHGACKLCDGEIPHGHASECDLYKVERERDEARAERDALRADFEWLEAKVFERKWNGLMGTGSHMTWNLARNWRHIVQRLRGDTLLAAIDAARKEQT